MSDLWPHQARGIQATLAAIDRGERRLGLTSPTGSGKTITVLEIIRRFLAQEKRAIFYTHRKLLLEQIQGILEDECIWHGVRAASSEEEPDPSAHFQIASIQTEYSRSIKKKRTDLFPADLVVVDEAHLHNNKTSRAVLDAHHEMGAVILLVTATPLGLGEMCDELIVAGTTSECRECGALVRAIHYGPDEPDLRKFKNLREGEDLSEAQNTKAIMRPGVFGRVWSHFERINPEHKPSILFAPSVAGSIWFAEQFAAKGVPAAHIDGEDIWLGGKMYKSSREKRQEVLDESKSGNIRVLCNRFVLREGLDCPWLQHGIFATVFGSLQSYLQSGGRLLRRSDGFDQVTIQDHGGNWWRWGSLNEDREWHLEITGPIAAAMRADRLRADTKKEPFACPECKRILMSRLCPCGFEVKKRSRAVVASDGSMVDLEGLAFVPHQVFVGDKGPKLWEQMFWRARSEKWDASFRAAEALFAKEQGRWPDRSWPLMPTNPVDWMRKVKDVPMSELIPKPDKET